MHESSVRGTHSYGFSYHEQSQVKTFKTHYILEAIKALENIRPDKFIFHNRYSTTGDWQLHVNNQPITANGESFVFNGVISQATKEENQEKYGITLQTDNDGELFLAAGDKKKFIENCRGSIAGLYMDDKLNIFTVKNRRRPLWIHHADDGSRIVASTVSILRRAGIEGCTEVKNGVAKL